MQSIHNTTATPALRHVLPSALGNPDPARASHLASSFNQQHLWRPLAASMTLSFVLMGLHGDQWLADALYAVQGHAWRLQSGYVTQDLLHAGGRQAVKYAWFGVLLAWLVSLKYPRLATWCRPLAYLLLSTLLAMLLVGALKRLTHMDCPWDLARYGGGKAYYGLFAPRPAGLPGSGCFPAGHASAGYAWVALYFFLLSTRPALRWWGLGTGLCLGLVFGTAQQLRGAHFLSHDVWALMASWLTALVLYRVMLWPHGHGLGPETSA
jgi:membrane-associated PAP2 superfamily phosphatase